MQEQGPLATVEVAGVHYQIHRMPALTQFHVARRVAPVLAALIPAFNLTAMLRDGLDGVEDTMSDEKRKDILSDLLGSLPSIAETFAKLPDQDAEYILNNCLDYVARKDGNRWSRVRRAGAVMYDDIQLPTLLRLSFEVIKGNMSDFFPTSQPKASAAGPQTSS